MCLQTPYLIDAQTHECVIQFESLIPGGTYSKSKHYQPLETVSSCSNNFHEEKTAFVNRLKKVARQLQQECQYDRAKVALELVLEHQQRLFGGDCHPDIVETHVQMATLARLQGNFEAGLDSYQQALDLALNVYGYDPVAAGICTAAGHFLLHFGKPMNALKMYQDNLRINAKLGDGDETQCLSVANGFVHCGLALEQLGQLQYALGNHQKALSIMTRLAAKNNKHRLKVAQIHCHIASALNRLGDYDQAQKHYQAALAIQQTLNGTESSMNCSTKNTTGRGAQVQ